MPNGQFGTVQFATGRFVTAKGNPDMQFFDREKEKEMRREIKLKALEGKSAAFFAKNPALRKRQIAFAGLSLEDM